MGEHVNPTSTAVLLKSERDIKTTDGRVYRIRFGTNACAAIEERFHLGESGQPSTVLGLLATLGGRGCRGLRAIMVHVLEHYHADEVGSGDAADRCVGVIIDDLALERGLDMELICAFHGMTPEQLAKAADDARTRLARKKAKGKQEDPLPEGDAAAGQPTS